MVWFSRERRAQEFGGHEAEDPKQIQSYSAELGRLPRVFELDMFPYFLSNKAHTGNEGI